MSNTYALIRMICYSGIGLFSFFVPITINAKTTILFDHCASYLASSFRSASIAFVVLLILYGSLIPFINGSWKTSYLNLTFSVFKIMGLVLACMYFFNIGPSVFFAPDVLPFLFEKLALTVGLIVPLGAVALSFLIGFGLLEFIGVLLEPIMRPLLRTPGYSAVDAVASFVGSYSIGLLITNRIFMQGRYTVREAVIIATGFSTVSTAFMVIVAKTLSLIPFWNFYFWSTLFITFTITSISAYIYPIANLPETRFKKVGVEEDPKLDLSLGRFKQALNAALEQSKKESSLIKVVLENFKEGLNMATIVVPSVLAIGFTGLMLAKYTPTFDVLGIILVPFCYLGGLENELATSRALASSLAEMFLPAIILKDADILSRYVAAVVSVSNVIFFSGSVPCILATKIPISMGKILLIWFVRIALGIVMAAWVGKLGINMGWLAI